MGLIVEIPDTTPRSALPPGGTPRDDLAYEEWRNGFLQRHAEIDLAIRWHEAANHPFPIQSWHIDSFLFDTLGRDPLFPMSWTHHHRIRFLAVAFKTRRKVLIDLATRYVNKVVSDAV